MLRRGRRCQADRSDACGHRDICQLIDSASTFGRAPEMRVDFVLRIDRLPWRLTCIGNVPTDRIHERTNGGTVDRLLPVVLLGFPIVSALKLLDAVLEAVVGEGV